MRATLRRPAVQRPPRVIRHHVKVFDGPLAGKTLAIPAPLEREIAYQETRYVVERHRWGHYAFAVRAHDPKQPVVAWRGWNVEREDIGRPILRSAVDAALWPTTAELVAKCDRKLGNEDDAPRAHDGEPVPADECTCGIWCTKTLWDLERAGGYDGLAIFGLIALKGRLQEHAIGYRGEMAYPVALFVNVRPEDAEGQFGPIAWRQKLAEYTRALGEAYRVPTAAAPPSRALDLIARLARDEGLPRWALRALPNDVRIHMARTR